jgi:adhesin transport system outer membrane protein
MTNKMRPINKKLILGISLFLGIFCTAAFGITLGEVVRISLETNPSISADEAAARASESDIDVARSGYFPSLDIVQSTIGYQYTKINEKLDPPLSFPLKGSAKRLVTNPTIVLSQTIFDGLATPFAVARAHRLAEASKSILGQTTEQIAYNAIAAYINYLAQGRLLEIAHENIKRHQDLLGKVKKRVTGGISTIADVYQVESRLEEAKVLKERIEGQVQVAAADYISVVGIPPQDLEDYDLPVAPFTCGMDDVIDRIYKHNPAVVVANDRLKVAIAVLDETISPFLPTIRAQLESNAPVLNPSGEKATEKFYTAQVVLDYNLLHGGRDVAARRSQIDRVVEAKKRVAVAVRDAERIGRTAWARYFSSDTEAAELEKDVVVNYKLITSYELQFELVARPLLDLVDAYVSYYRSENDLVSAIADRDTNHALLLASMGDLVRCMAPGVVKSDKKSTND